MSEPRDKSSSSAMTPERWARLEPLVDTALDLSADERRELVWRVTAEDAGLGAELERLLNRLERADSLFDLGAVQRSALLSEDSGGGVSSRDLQAKLQASLGGAYAIERELGGGGMSRVFVANEAGLGRKVVIKVLAPELSAGISAERFEREIKLAASLQQANIVPLLAAGNADGFPYYTMPLVEGRSLQERLTRDGPLPIGDAINVLRDVARALAFAHERGIVHRDIKPGNVLLSGGTAVVTDFGIAKALGAASSNGALATTLTQSGIGIGTPAYMSPEQAAGDPETDHRTDIYAFGCVAHEVLTGKPPFHGRAMHHIIAAHFSETPPSVRDQRVEVPGAIADLVARCLEKRPDRRPQTAAELLQTLDAVNSQPFVLAPRRSRPSARFVSAAALALVAGSYIVYRVADEKILAPQPLLLSVLPFANVAGDTSLEYRATGISDELMTAMGRVPGIRITGRNAALQFKGPSLRDIRKAERDLGARLLVTGTLRETAGRIVVSAQLNDSLVAGELWADTFERSVKDIGSVSQDIAREISDTLRARFGRGIGGSGPRPPTGGTTNAEALDLYMLGQELVRHRGPAVMQGVSKFERAIALDPKYARAYAALARALGFLPYFNGIAPDEVRDRIASNAQRALALDSTLADAHTALGFMYISIGQFDRGVAEYERAVAFEPDNFESRVAYGRYLATYGSTAEALTQLDQARKVERLSPLVSAWAAYSLFLQGKIDTALAESSRAAQLAPELLPVINLTSLINVATGHPDVARRMVALNTPVGLMTNAPYVYAKLGDTATAMRMIRSMESANPRPWFTDVARATVMLGMGDTARALDALAKSQAASGPVWTQYVPLRDPAFDAVRANPRFMTLLKQAGVDVRLLTSPRPGSTR